MTLMSENTATSRQHSSQNIFNEITASIGATEIFSTNLIQDNPQQFSMPSFSTQRLAKSETNLNVFSHHGLWRKHLKTMCKVPLFWRLCVLGSFNECDRKVSLWLSLFQHKIIIIHFIRKSSYLNKLKCSRNIEVKIRKDVISTHKSSFGLIMYIVKASNTRIIFYSSYPPNIAKESLASAIVSEFPLLKNNVIGCKGYEHYYDSKTKQGFIEYRLWTIRTKLSPQKKKNYTTAIKRKAQCLRENSNASNSDLVLLDKCTLEEKILWMKRKLPSDCNKEAIKNCLKETFLNRRQWIVNSGPVISNIFEKYPRLLDYYGEMIEQDFSAIYPNCENNFLAKFPSFYTNKILGYIAKYRPDIMKKIDNLSVNDDALRALIALTLLLPPLNYSRKNNGETIKNKGKKKLQKRDNENTFITEVPNPHLIKILPEETNLSYTEKNLRTQTNDNVQPYIMCIGSQEGTSFFVQGDGWFFTLPHRITPIAAFDLLFKLYQVLHVSYPSSLLNFYNFIENFIYRINENPSNTASSLHINICNVEIDESREERIQ